MSGSEHKVSDRQDARLTIAYLARGVGGGVGQALWTGLIDAARERDVNLICFVGDRLRDPEGSSLPANVIYDLVDASMVDGLVSWASSVGGALEHGEIVDFHRRYHPLPVVSIALPMEGIPTLLADSYEGMYEAVVHLIEVHGYRRLAFVRGPKGHYYAAERYRAYVDALEAHAIPLDPNLVTPHGDFTASTGIEGIRLLLDERGLRPGTDFEAVVMVSDMFVLNALEELEARALRVPGDVALVGFNDAKEGRFVTPPLTSVRLPLHEQGKKAVETVLALIEGKEVPGEVILPSELVVRRSCGCESLAVTQAGVRDGLGVEQAMRDIEKILDPGWAERLLDGFVADSQAGSTGAFLATLDDALHQMATASDDVAGDIAAMQNVISTLRRSLLPTLDGEPLSRAEDLCQQARVMVGEAVERARSYEALQTERQAAALRDVGQALLTTFDVGGLMDVLAEGLPRLGIPSAYLSLYEDPGKPAGWARLMLACQEAGPSGSRRVELDADGVRFSAPQLMPQEMWSRKQRYSFLVRSLHFHGDQLGFILYGVGPREGEIYDVLSTQISNALQGALLVQRVREHSADLTRQQYILDTFMENVPDSIYFKDLASRFTRINKALARHFELGDPAEGIGKSDHDFFPEEQAQPKYEQEQEIIRTGEPILNLEEPDGIGHWALTTKMPLRDENSEIIGTFGISRDITAMKEAQVALEKAYAEVEQQVRERTAELEREIEERERAQAESLRLQQEVIEAQQRAIQELSTPIIPVLEGVIVMPLIGSIDTLRARDVTRSLLTGIREHRARVVILDITGVPIIDSGVAAYLNKTVQAARLKGARTIITGISESVAETVVDLGIDWSGIETLSDLRTGLRAALESPRAASAR